MTIMVISARSSMRKRSKYHTEQTRGGVGVEHKTKIVVHHTHSQTERVHTVIAASCLFTAHLKGQRVHSTQWQKRKMVKIQKVKEPVS